MSNLVEFLSNPSRKKGRRRGRRKMTAKQRRYFGPRRKSSSRRTRSRRSASPRRRARRNPTTFVTVPATMNPSRRRYRRNPSLKPAALMKMVGPAIAGALAALAGWVAAKTILGAKDQGLPGVGVNAAGSIAFAVAGSATIARKNPSLKAGLWMGAVIGPVLRFAVDSLRGRRLPFGLKTGFEDCYPMTLRDYFVTRPGGAGSMADFLMTRPRRPLALAGGGLGYAEAGTTPFGSR